MEDWQCKHITKHLAKLIELTIFNCIVMAELVANNILSKAEVEKLEAEKKQYGNSQASYRCYQLLMGRTNAYKVLTRTLLQTNQSGAARILIRVPTEVFSKPLTYLGISTKLDSLKKVLIEVNGKTFELQNFLPAVNYDKQLQIIHETIPELEIYDTFVTKETTFVLTNNTIPPEPPFYVSRFLSNRIKICETIFKADRADVFVFKNSIERYKVSQIAKPHYTASSNSQLTKITSRFIYSVENEDWIDLKNSAKVPIHLIHYEPDQNVFLLEDSSLSSNILTKVGSRKDRVYLSEDEFLKQQLSEDSMASCLCICDTPGMGKTFLLANIARLMANTCTGRIIAFIPLASFTADFSQISSNICFPETSIRLILRLISPSEEKAELLFKWLKAELIFMEIFFDGFDEISSEKVELMKTVFQSLTSNSPNVRIYISSRPHMRQELEETLGVLAYDILPFNQQNQVNFLIQSWSRIVPNSDETSLHSYATSCIEAINKSLSSRDKEITGIPLLCQLISEIYVKKVTLCLTKRRKFCDVPLKIPEMYHHFVEEKIRGAGQTEEEFKRIKLVHTWHAVKLLFPEESLLKSNQFTSINHLLTFPGILKIGILQKLSSDSALSFVHRTFAEYLVADYLSTKLQHFKEIPNAEEMNSDALLILKLILKCQKSDGFYFPHFVIMFFLDFFLGKTDIVDELMNQVAQLLISVHPKEIVSMLRACCRDNLNNVFSLLKESLSKYDIKYIQENFKTDNAFNDHRCYKLLSDGIENSSSQLFNSCVQLFTEVLKIDVPQFAGNYSHGTLLQLAVKCANYEAVEYLLDIVPLKDQRILVICATGSYDDPLKIQQKENILHLLLHKDPSLINETPDILNTKSIHLRFIKILLEGGAQLSTANSCGDNCAMNAAKHMSPDDYHELIIFLLTECKAEYLFHENSAWSDPIGSIIQFNSLLPATLELLLNIPGIDINMKDRNGHNLLHSAARGNNLGTLKRLVDLGVDYEVRGSWNETLLHVAARNGCVDMVYYLLSLKLDPNSVESYLNRTPLHFAVRNNLSIVQLLVENGANVQGKDEEGHTSLHLCAMNSAFSASTEETIKYLIQKGLGVNDGDNEGKTPLRLCRNEKFREWLVERGADINAKNKKGETPSKKNLNFLS